MNYKLFYKCIGIFVLTAIYHSHLASGKIQFNKDGDPYIKFVHGGTLSGLVEKSRNDKPYFSFVGIPYGFVPRRFEAPQTMQRRTWDGVKNAIAPGYICPQAKRTLDTSNGVPENENCLYLNVYVPHTKDSDSPLPVMVWIHGGGFMVGNAVFYQPTFLMDNSDVILVTINYRLGVFGFLSTADNAVSANNGLKDQVMALKWVQENIETFGGDHGKVTIFGESAGAAAVHYLMLSPSAQGLFHRAISQSGSALGLWAYQQRPKDNARALAAHVGCSDLTSSKDIVNCLRKLTTEELAAAQMSYKTGWPRKEFIYFFGPTREPEGVSNPFLMTRPEDALMNDDSYLADVPWITGVTEDEGCIFFSAIVLNSQDMIDELNDNWYGIAPNTLFYGKVVPAAQEKIVSEKIHSFYFGNSPISADTSANLTNLFSDTLINYSVYRAALATASKPTRRSPVYFYQYAYSGPASLIGLAYQLTEGEAKKIGHGDELQHQFDLGFNKNLKEEKDLQFSKNLLWTSFAVKGYPSHSSWGEKWEPLSKDAAILKWYKIDENPRNVAVDPKFKERMEFWDDIWKNHVNPKKSPTKNQKTEL